MVENKRGLHLDVQAKKDCEKLLKKQSWILNDCQMEGSSRYHIFQALFRSKVFYAINIATMYCNKTKNWL